MSDKPKMPAREKFMKKMLKTEIPIPAWERITMHVDDNLKPNEIKITCGKGWYARWHKQQYGN